MGAALKSGKAAAELRQCLDVKNFRERLWIFTRAGQIRRLKYSPGHSDGHRADAATVTHNAGECRSHSPTVQSQHSGSSTPRVGARATGPRQSRHYRVFPGGPARGAGTASLGAAVGSGSVGAGSAGLSPTGGVILAVTTWATTTATITSGITASTSEASSMVASSTEASGSLRIATLIAPMPMATAGTNGRPGRCDMAAPPTVPMNIAGNVGPPRKLLSDTL